MDTLKARAMRFFDADDQISLSKAYTHGVYYGVFCDVHFMGQSCDFG